MPEEALQEALAGLAPEQITGPGGLMTQLAGRVLARRLSELYGTEIGRNTISRVTDAVLEDIAVWRSRPLAAVYLIVYRVWAETGSMDRRRMLSIGLSISAYIGGVPTWPPVSP